MRRSRSAGALSAAAPEGPPRQAHATEQRLSLSELVAFGLVNPCVDAAVQNSVSQRRTRADLSSERHRPCRPLLVQVEHNEGRWCPPSAVDIRSRLCPLCLLRWYRSNAPHPADPTRVPRFVRAFFRSIRMSHHVACPLSTAFPKIECCSVRAFPLPTPRSFRLPGQTYPGDCPPLSPPVRFQRALYTEVVALPPHQNSHMRSLYHSSLAVDFFSTSPYPNCARLSR